MSDRNKIINAIEKAKKQSEEYAQDHIIVPFKEADMILAMLKEQEAVKPSWSRGKPFCSACGLQIRGGKYCSECGKPISWESR